MTQEPSPTKGSFYQKLLTDLKKRKPLRSPSFSGTGDALERVREYEKSATVAQQEANLVAVKGEDIEKLALLDPSTELYNHRAFVKELKAELARAKRYKHSTSMCLISIDNFDQIVRDYGALTADAIQKVVANVIRTCVRETDIPAKYSSIQFGIVFPQTNAAGASLVAERMRQRIGNQAIVHNWQNFSVTASVGVATHPDHAHEYDELIARSLEGLEYATNRGGDRVFAM